MIRNINTGDVVYAQAGTNEWKKYYLQGWLPMQSYNNEQLCKIILHEDSITSTQFNYSLTIKEKGILTLEEFRELRLNELLPND